VVGILPLFFREHLAPLGWAAGLHAALLVFLSLSFALSRPPVVPVRLAIKATVIDESATRARREREERERLAEQRRQEELADQTRREVERREAELKQQREAEQARLRTEAEAAELARQTELNRQREIETERQRQADERRVAEERRRAEEQRAAEERQAAEQRRQAEERRKAEAAAHRQAELQAELAAQLEIEEQRLQAERSGLLGQYIALIQQRVTRNWIRPPEARAGIDCEVFVTQIPGGEVIGVRFGQCNGDDVVRRSIEAAVFRSSPLPRPPHAALFERNLVFDFRPE